MELENTLENKIKFFAQYFNQTVLYNIDIDYIMVLNAATLGNHHEGDCLLLTPLSKISDEDAIEVAKIVLSSSSQYHTVKDGRYYIEMFENRPDDAEFYFDTGVHTIDYLRSKGYALSWMSLSVEKLLEYGWIKLEG